MQKKNYIQRFEFNIMQEIVKPRNFNWTGKFKEANLVNGIGKLKTFF